MTTPTYSELYTSIQTDLRNRLGITSLVGKTVLNAFAAVQAAKLKIFYLAIAFVYKNNFPDTADSEEIGGTLERFGLVKLGRLPFTATAGEYSLNVTGEIGATIPLGTTFKSLDSSTSPDKLFRLDSAFTFVATSGIIQVRALDLGSSAQLQVGDELQITSPLANVDSFQDVDSVDVTPTDAEPTETYRDLVIEAYQIESQGGAKTDYRIWSADAAGVRRVYPYLKNLFPGTVQLYVEANPDDSTPVGSGIPSAAILADVVDVCEFDPDITKPLNERGRRPMTSTLEVLAINTLDVDVDIVNLSDTSFLTAIENALIGLLFDIRPFIDGADNPRNAATDLLYQADIYGVVIDVIGADATFDSLTLEVDGTPITTSYEFTGDDIPYLNSVTAS